MAHPTVVLGTTCTGPSLTTGNGGLQFPVGQTRTEMGESDATWVSQIRSCFSTQHEPSKPTVISFNEERIAPTPGDTSKFDVVPVVPHSGSSDIDIEVVERKSRHPDLESPTGTS
ncbi:hypothetical protein FRC08_001519 [Ceratobasidium sp. 394]|nr:hypothetical protein FRC08_001519 [Ceratobasidium sp. 394]